MQSPPHILFDLSRLALRLRYPATGIDRVELAYAEHLLAHEAGRTSFLLGVPGITWGVVPQPMAAQLVAMVARRWRTGGRTVSLPFVIGLVLAMLANALRRSVGLAPPPPAPVVYLNVSHLHLDRPGRIRAMLDWARARMVVMVHDLIPIAFPEYARPGEAARHRRRISTVLGQAGGMLVNSRDTQLALATQSPGCTLPVSIVPLGVDPPARIPPGSVAPPVAPGLRYFVCLGTIEPRKNHLLLLHLWRQLAQAGGTVPHLHVLGRRGWENEMVVDLLERCTPIHPYVHEHNALPDAEVRALLRGAAALLMPSFVEGYGLPLAEALAEGVPVLCSDLPAHREIGGAVPEYLDPLDGKAWLDALCAYAEPANPRRAAQLARLAAWQAPSWDTHICQALEFVARCASPVRQSGELEDLVFAAGKAGAFS